MNLIPILMSLIPKMKTHAPNDNSFLFYFALDFIAALVQLLHICESFKNQQPCLFGPCLVKTHDAWGWPSNQLWAILWKPARWSSGLRSCPRTSWSYMWLRTSPWSYSMLCLMWESTETKRVSLQCPNTLWRDRTSYIFHVSMHLSFISLFSQCFSGWLLLVPSLPKPWPCHTSIYPWQCARVSHSRWKLFSATHWTYAPLSLLHFIILSVSSLLQNPDLLK